MSNLSELITRVEGLTGPDREVDYDIWAAIEPSGIWDTSSTQNLLMPWPQWRELHAQDAPVKIYGRPQNHQAYTGSLDATIALVERVLPGWNGDLDFGASICDDGSFGCRLFDPKETRGRNHAGEGKTPALAMLSALLRAKQADPSHNGEREP